MITIRYWMQGLGTRRHTFTNVVAAADCVDTVRRMPDMDLIDIAAKPALLGALALACTTR
jgi:hypothetical protein